MAAMAAFGVETENHSDPGAAPFGNFLNYYTFNPPENRLGLIPTTLLQDLGYGTGTGTVLMLDVGCNSGDMSVGLYQHLQQQLQSGEPKPDVDLHILGFDLDEDLIARAQQSNPFPQNISFIPLDIIQDPSTPSPQDPSTPSPQDSSTPSPQDSSTQLSSPLQLYLREHGCPRFHLSLCLAVTMWVHLTHGDAALLSLLSRLASLSQYLLLEAQPWKCYRSAARRLRKLGRSDFDHFKVLQIRGDIAEHARNHLEQCCGMELVRSFGSTAWDRQLLLFRRR